MKYSTKMNKALLGSCKGVILLFALILYFSFVPSVLAVTLEPGDLIVADFNGAFGGYGGPSPPGSGLIIKVDPSTGAQTMISSGNLLDAPYSVALDAAGNIIVLDKANSLGGGTGVVGQIIKVNPADGSQTVISEDGLFVNPYGIAIDAAGNIIVADQLYAVTGGIIKVHPITGAQTVISSGGSIKGLWDVTIDPAGNLYVTSSPGSGYLSVIKVDPTNGAQTIISSGTFSVSTGGGIVIDDTTGDIFVSEVYYYNGIIKVAAGTGAQTVFSSGSPFQDPYQLDIDLSGNIVAADTNWFWAGRIIKVDPGSGAKTLISSGGLLVDPAGIVVYEWQQPSNRPPVADAGPDQTVEQDSYAGGSVTLDGSDSYDPDDDPLTYSWTWDGVSTSSVSPTIVFPLGTTTITLVVNDGTVDSNPDTVDITVQDTTPPTITSISVSPDVLWPPNHKMMDVTVSVDAEDICDPEPFSYILGVTSNEPINGPGDGNTEPDWELFTDQPLVVMLRAESAGVGTGRVYTISVECIDASGNIASATVDVTVPHDQGKGKGKK